IGSNTLNVAGSLSTTSGTGILDMSSNGTMTVQLNATFDGGNETGRLSAGELRVGGNFLQNQPCGYGNSANFHAAGTHTLILNGAASQSVQFNCPASSHVRDLVVDGAGATLASNIVIDGLATLTTGNFVGSGRLATITGGLNDTALRWKVSSTTFTTTPTVLPDSMQSAITFVGTVTLPHDFKVLGDLDIGAGSNVVVGAHQLTTTGSLRTLGGSGVLTMSDPAAMVVVGGDALFDGGTETTLLTAGTRCVAGSFTQNQPCGYGNSANFNATGSHRTILDGSAASTVRFNCPSASAFQNLLITNSAGVAFQTGFTVHDTTSVAASAGDITGATLPTLGGPLIDPGNHWRIGSILLLSSASITPSDSLPRGSASGTHRTVLVAGLIVDVEGALNLLTASVLNNGGTLK
ncbi:MAG: hypothetical protein ABIS27_03435, partial [Longimicrobiales bacterium]